MTTINARAIAEHVASTNAAAVERADAERSAEVGSLIERMAADRDFTFDQADSDLITWAAGRLGLGSTESIGAWIERELAALRQAALLREQAAQLEKELQGGETSEVLAGKLVILEPQIALEIDRLLDPKRKLLVKLTSRRESERQVIDLREAANAALTRTELGRHGVLRKVPGAAIPQTRTSAVRNSGMR